jgi:hypothetical protein
MLPSTRSGNRQALKWPGEISRKATSVLWHSGCTKRQRGAKGQPGGKVDRLGGDP